MNVEVKLRTDDYPGETNWTLINECGANENISMSGALTAKYALCTQSQNASQWASTHS